MAQKFRPVNLLNVQIWEGGVLTNPVDFSMATLMAHNSAVYKKEMNSNGEILLMVCKLSSTSALVGLTVREVSPNSFVANGADYAPGIENKLKENDGIISSGLLELASHLCCDVQKIEVKYVKKKRK